MQAWWAAKRSSGGAAGAPGVATGVAPEGFLEVLTELEREASGALSAAYAEHDGGAANGYDDDDSYYSSSPMMQETVAMGEGARTEQMQMQIQEQQLVLTEEMRQVLCLHFGHHSDGSIDWRQLSGAVRRCAPPVRQAAVDSAYDVVRDLATVRAAGCLLLR